MRRITDTLYIGDATDGRTRGHEFGRVISMADSNENTTQSFPIRDGDHDYTVFANAVDVVVDGLNVGDRVLVHC
jgi:DNA-binding beta-propeller fold protein YncE